jgi:tetraacyldisaccharide 4'-kinase
VEAAAFPDHHAYAESDVARLLRRAGRVDRVVCTLKDAVKLGPRWPRHAPALWYVSQRVTVERGESVLEDLLGRLLTARSRAASPAA